MLLIFLPIILNSASPGLVSLEAHKFPLKSTSFPVAGSTIYRFPFVFIAGFGRSESVAKVSAVSMATRRRCLQSRAQVTNSAEELQVSI